MGFGRACAPVRCAYPSFWAYEHAKGGAARPPRPVHRCFAASYSSPKNKITYFQKQKASLQAQTRAARGVYLSTGLSCTLLSYIAPYWATLQLQPPELRSALFWATLHHVELPEQRLTLNELRCTLKNKWPPLHPSQLRWSFWVLTKLMIYRENPAKFPETKCFSSAPNSGCQGRIPVSFHCTTETYTAKPRKKSEYGPPLVQRG